MKVVHIDIDLQYKTPVKPAGEEMNQAILHDTRFRTALTWL